MVDYYVRVLNRAAGEAWNVTVQQVVPGFIMGALGLRLSYGLGETLPAYARGLIAILMTSAAYVVGAFLWNLLRAPYLLDRDLVQNARSKPTAFRR